MRQSRQKIREFSLGGLAFTEELKRLQTLTSESRLLLIAPHPDDEALACSVILQRAARAGAAIRVVYATDGDNNPWPQRVLERKWHLRTMDRERWGALRRAEAVAALEVLGVDAIETEFLGLPDQGLTNLLRIGCEKTRRRFRKIIQEWAPTHLLLPSISDTHPDHNSLGVILRLALLEMEEPQTSIWSYVVHGRSPAFFSAAAAVSASKNEAERKLAAILCHQTQVKLSRKRFLSYADRAEHFLKLDETTTIRADGAIQRAVRQNDQLTFTARFSPKFVRAKPPMLLVAGMDLAGSLRCMGAPLPSRSCEIEMANCAALPRVIGRYRGNAFAGAFRIPLDLFSPIHPIFVKIERRSVFFDEAGWIELAPTALEQWRRPMAPDRVAAVR